MPPIVGYYTPTSTERSQATSSAPYYGDVIDYPGVTEIQPGSYIFMDSHYNKIGGKGQDDNTFSVVGSGTDIWGTADAFNFAYQSMTGDGLLVARVASLGNTNSWAKAAVMIRNGLSANAAFADMIVTSAKGTAFQYRASAGASAINVSGPLAAAPYWLKIVRAGSIFSGYVSADGANWTLVGQASIAMGSTVEIGLAVTSHDNTRTTTGAFTNITR